MVRTVTLPETNIAPENGPSQKETNLPTIHFQGLLAVSFREGGPLPETNMTSHLKPWMVGRLSGFLLGWLNLGVFYDSFREGDLGTLPTSP